MYHSKQNGGNSFAFYSPEMNAAAVERLMLKSKLRRSLERDEFMMHYQPKVDLRDGRIVGARRCCAGACRATATSRPRSSSRWPRRPTSSWKSASGC
jgi:predicted signal transduction protein with EAL and GGDEF domain